MSDMTSFKFWIYYFEVTFYFDVFTKEILSYWVAERRGHRDQYIDGLKDVVELLRGNPEPTVIKFVRKRRENAVLGSVSTFEKETD